MAKIIIYQEAMQFVMGCSGWNIRYLLYPLELKDTLIINNLKDHNLNSRSKTVKISYNPSADW
jgi:hypothetical protein